MSSDIKREIKSHLAQASAEQDVNANAAANGMSYEQALALTAAYYLVDSYPGVTVATWEDWKAQVKAM